MMFHRNRTPVHVIVCWNDKVVFEPGDNAGGAITVRLLLNMSKHEAIKDASSSNGIDFLDA